MEFRCRLGTQTGEVTEEMHVAESESTLRQELEAKGLYVLSLSRRGALGWPGLSFAKRRRIKTREFLVFNQELATLLRAGMPLVQSLDILRQRVEDPSFKAALDDVHDRVSAGAALSEAFEAQGETIPGIYTASLLAGEKSGGLEEVIRRYVAHVKVITAVKRKTLSALVYPAILLLLSLVVVSIIVLRVVPEFEGFYQSFDAELPIATRMIVAVSAFLRSYLFFVVLGLGGAVAAVWSWLRRPGGVAMLDRLILRLPAVGTIAGRFATSQLTRTLATLLSGGIPLVNAIDVASRALGNRSTRENRKVLKALERAAHDEESMVRVEAVLGLGMSASPTAGPTLLDALGDTDPRVKMAAADAFTFVKFEPAIDALVDTLRSEDGLLRRVAGEALSHQTGQHYGEDYGLWREWLAQR